MKLWVIRLGAPASAQWWSNDHGWCDDITLATVFNDQPHGHPPDVSLPIGEEVHWHRLFHEDPRVHELICAVNDLMSNAYDCDQHMDMETGTEHEDYARVSAALDAFA